MISKYIFTDNISKRAEAYLFHTVKWFHSPLYESFYSISCLYSAMLSSVVMYYQQFKLDVQTVLFQTIQFSISTQFKCQTVLFDIDRALSGVTTLGKCGPGSGRNFPRSPSITGTSPSDCLVSYPGHSFVGGLTPLQTCNRCILLPQPTRPLVIFKYKNSSI